VKVYWSRCGHGHGNFGDKLTPLLLRHYGVPCEWAPIEHAELVGVGSVLERVPENFRGTILTTGFMHESSRRAFPLAQVLAVRGKLTRDRVADAATAALGDAGLLCDEFPTAPRKRFKLGVIPHFADAGDPLVGAIAALGGEVTVIDICAETLEVIRRVSECEHILSSSLHGLILADSLGIPNRWTEFHHAASRVEGAGFKFRDYYSVFGLEPEPLVLRPRATLAGLIESVPPFVRPGIEEIKDELRRVMRSVRDRVKPPSAEAQQARADAQAEWHSRLARLQSLLARHIPAGAEIVLADDDQLRSSLTTVRAIPFLERDGVYWGPPGRDDEAVAELRRAAEGGVEWFIIAWPMFWLLDQFPEFARHLREHGRVIAQDESAMLFRLPAGSKAAR